MHLPSASPFHDSDGYNRNDMFELSHRLIGIYKTANVTQSMELCVLFGRGADTCARYCD